MDEDYVQLLNAIDTRTASDHLNLGIALCVGIADVFEATAAEGAARQGIRTAWQLVNDPSLSLEQKLEMYGSTLHPLAAGSMGISWAMNANGKILTMHQRRAWQALEKIYLHVFQEIVVGTVHEADYQEEFPDPYFPASGAVFFYIYGEELPIANVEAFIAELDAQPGYDMAYIESKLGVLGL